MTWQIPTLAECNPNLEPFEFQCVVAMGTKPEKTAGGILLPTDTQDRENFRAERARLVAVSPAAFSYHDWGDQRTPQPGDIVLTSKFPGQEFEGQDGKPYRICIDRDIKAVIERAGG